MSLIISQNQITFIFQQLITYNILIVHAVLHYLKTRKTGKNHALSLKLDMNKVYEQADSGDCVLYLNYFLLLCD